MTSDSLPTKEILREQRRKNYQLYKEDMRKKRAQLKKNKEEAKKLAKDKKLSDLQKMLRPASELPIKES